MKKLLTVVGLLLLTATAVRADIIALPPKKLTLTGTLGWSTDKRPDAVEVKTLTLTSAEGKVVTLLHRPQMKNPNQYDQFLGKKVVVTVMAYEAGGKGRPEFFVQSITDIKAAPAAKR